tara:strand:+ start:1525 stop:1749 length:225 start_codon:yes stop_codon:yes gene_type:complete
MENVVWKHYLQLLSNKYGVDLIKMSFERAEEYVTEKEWHELMRLMKYHKRKLSEEEELLRKVFGEDSNIFKKIH